MIFFIFSKKFMPDAFDSCDFSMHVISPAEIALKMKFNIWSHLAHRTAHNFPAAANSSVFNFFHSLRCRGIFIN